MALEYVVYLPLQQAKFLANARAEGWLAVKGCVFHFWGEGFYLKREWVAVYRKLTS